MSREVHVPFCERPRVRFPRSTHLQAQQIWLADDWAPHLQTFEGPTSISEQEWIRLIHPDHRGYAIDLGERALKGEAPGYSAEYQFKTKNGGWQWRHVYGTVTERDAAGQPLCVCGTYRDITQQKHDQEALRKLTAELQHRALHDSLTGVLNRGAVLEALDAEAFRAGRDHSEVTVALLDVDHFKAVNDSHGHQVGDQALRMLVERIRKVLRPYDLLGRYGGEEFLIVAPSKNGIADLHERICLAIADTPFVTSVGPLALTASIGVSVYTGAAYDQNALLAAADEALYLAKQMGRNQVATAG